MLILMSRHLITLAHHLTFLEHLLSTSVLHLITMDYPLNMLG